MLTDRYIADCPNELVKIYSQLETDVLALIAKRLAKATKGNLELTQWQIEILQECGTLRADVERLIAKYDRLAQAEILRVFNEAMQASFQNDIEYAERGMSENQRQHITTLADRLASPRVNKDYGKMLEKYANDFAFNNIRRLTQTIADTSQTAFMEQANNAYMQVASGAVDYTTAIKNACHDLASKGIHTVEYSQSGKTIHRSIESAVRANVITGINQQASEQTLQNCEALENDLVETSAHLGARNKDGKHAWSNHEAWQGRVFHLGSGRHYTDGDGNKQYAPSFKESCGLGFADGICGVNCRHSYYPYFEGTKNTFEPLEEKEIEVDGEKITQYEAEQQLRHFERGVRHWKRHADILKAAGEDNSQARIKIKEWQQKAKDWTDKTGIKRDYAREFTGSSNADRKQIYGLTKTTTGTRKLVEYANGGAVVTAYAKKTDEEDDNLIATTPLARAGRSVTLLPEDKSENGKQKRKYDAIINHEKWEVKTIGNKSTNLKTSVNSAFKRAHGQANNIIISIQKEVDYTELKAYINKEVHNRTYVEKVIIVRNGNFEEYDRDVINNWYNENEKIKAIVDSLYKKKK